MKLAFFFMLTASMSLAYSQSSHKNLNSFLEKHCSDCHADGVDKGGLDFDKLKYSLKDEGNFAEWEGIYDRVMSGEMPPKKKKKRPTKAELESFHTILSAELYKHHGQTRGTVLRRLNNQEYENTLNDIFGTNERIADMLPEDGRSHEFDNVGESLGISMIQLQLYMKGIKVIMKKAIENFGEVKPSTKRTAKYQDDKGYTKFTTNSWKELPDGAIVRFETGSYPNGKVKGTGVKESGYYKVSVTGYGYQTTKPITFSVGGLSHTAGAEKPIYQYFTFPSSKETTVEFTTFIKKGYMLTLEPYGIHDRDRYKRKKNNQTIDAYKGPGLAIKYVTMEGPLIDEFPSKGHKLIFDGLKRIEVP
ncbi:MAG: DUF1587 domain-containing protein, partial [Lentisphaeraceae bacterium]|nr:DUF1587 domain-containing protein [Lentisphaeraceae bacterium]